MAASFDEILSVDDFKSNYGLQTAVDQDANIQDAIRAAIDYVTSETGLPLMDRVDEVRLPLITNAGILLVDVAPAGTNLPIAFKSSRVTSVVKIEYHEVGQNAAEAPTGLLTTANNDLRIVINRNSSDVLIYPLVNQYKWPDRAPETPFVLSLARGVKMTGVLSDTPPIDNQAYQIRKTVMLVAERFYYSKSEFRETDAIFSLVSALKSPSSISSFDWVTG